MHLPLQRAQPLGHPMEEGADLLHSGIRPRDTHTQVTSGCHHMRDLTIQGLLAHSKLLVEEFIRHLRQTEKN